MQGMFLVQYWYTNTDLGLVECLDWLPVCFYHELTPSQTCKGPCAFSLHPTAISSSFGIHPARSEAAAAITKLLPSLGRAPSYLHLTKLPLPKPFIQVPHQQWEMPSYYIVANTIICIFILCSKYVLLLNFSNYKCFILFFSQPAI